MGAFLLTELLLVHLKSVFKKALSLVLDSFRFNAALSCQILHRKVYNFIDTKSQFEFSQIVTARERSI